MIIKTTRKQIKNLCVLSLLIGYAGLQNAYATMPVIDFSVLAKLGSEYGQLKKQYEEMKNQYGAVTGRYGWGNWNNNLSYLQNEREWGASDWQSSLGGMAGGNPERYQELLAQYKQQHASMSQDDYSKGAEYILDNRTITYLYLVFIGALLNIDYRYTELSYSGIVPNDPYLVVANLTL